VPFWVRANTRPGRWHVVGDPPTQYWSLTPAGAWAELIRCEGLTTEAELNDIRIAIWVCRLSSMGLADLHTPEIRDHYNLRLSDLTTDTWAACQQAGSKIRADGARGILAPSAGLPNAVNLTLFGPRRTIAFDRKPALASAVPSAIAAIGRPPKGLVDRVLRRTVSPTLF
jgi:RES domain-containing protein